MNFKNCYFSFLDYIKLKQKIQSYNSLVYKFNLHILPYFKNCNIEDITFNDYLNWQKIIDEKNFSYNYKKNLHIVFSSFLDFCVKCYDLKFNVAKQVGQFSKKNCFKNEPSIYTYNEFNIFINCFDNIIYKTFFEFLFFTGCRPGEAMALKFSDLKGNYISINKTMNEHGKREINSPKTKNSIRTIIIDRKLKNNLLKLKKYYIKKYNNTNYDYFIFGGIKPLAPTTINRYKIKACEKANLKPLKLHEFRHSHATLLLEKNIVINEISRRLGHSKTSITLDIYCHAKKEHEKKVFKTLNFIRLFKL